MQGILQVLDILSHVNKRVRGHEQIKLPLQALLDLFLADTSPPLVSSVEQQLAAVRQVTQSFTRHHQAETA